MVNVTIYSSTMDPMGNESWHVRTNTLLALSRIIWRGSGCQYRPQVRISCRLFLLCKTSLQDTWFTMRLTGWKLQGVSCQELSKHDVHESKNSWEKDSLGKETPKPLPWPLEPTFRSCAEDGYFEMLWGRGQDEILERKPCWMITLITWRTHRKPTEIHKSYSQFLGLKVGRCRRGLSTCPQPFCEASKDCSEESFQGSLSFETLSH